ncbi:hypothetical protein VaNZ11_009182, partial [Volvox africanus]
GGGGSSDQRGSGQPGAPPSPLRGRPGGSASQSAVGVGAAGVGVGAVGSVAGRYGSRVADSPLRSAVATDPNVRGVAGQADVLKGPAAAAAANGASAAADRLAGDFSRLQGPSAVAAAAAGMPRQAGANAALPYVLANGRVKLR